MLAEEIFAKVLLKIPPHRVDVVVIILSIVVLKQEGWPLHPVVMAFAAFQAPSPGELHLIHSSVLYLLKIVRCYVSPVTVNIILDQLQQRGFLLGSQLAASDA